MSPQVKITDDIHAAANLFALAFRNIPLTAFVYRTPESTWPVSNIPLDIIGPKMIEGVKYKLACGAELVEADNFAAAAIWFPPGVALSSSSDDSEAIVAFREMASRAKKTFMGDKKYYYLNMVARHPDRTEPGVVRALFEPYIARAREEKVPIWLEAVSEHSKQVYEHFGFKTVAILRMGEGKASPDGELQEGGEGIILWAMILE